METGHPREPKNAEAWETDLSDICLMISYLAVCSSAKERREGKRGWMVFFFFFLCSLSKEERLVLVGMSNIRSLPRLIVGISV